MVGSMVAEVWRGKKAAVPNYVSGVDGGRGHIDVFSFGSAYLGPSTHPFIVVGDPSDAKFEVEEPVAPARHGEQIAGPARAVELASTGRSAARTSPARPRG